MRILSLFIIVLGIAISNAQVPFPPADLIETEEVINTNPVPIIQIGTRATRNLTRLQGTNVVFNVVATAPTNSTGELIYQWSRKGVTNSTLTLTNIQPKVDSDIYSVAVTATFLATNTVGTNTIIITNTSTAYTTFTLTVVDTNILSYCYTNISFNICPTPFPSVLYYGIADPSNWIASIYDLSNLCNPPLIVGTNWSRSYNNTFFMGTNARVTVSNLQAGRYFFSASSTNNGFVGDYGDEIEKRFLPKISPTLALALLTDGTPQLMTKVCPEASYIMQWTTNFTSWNVLVSTNADQYGNIIVEDNANAPLRFYRLKL